MLTEFHDEREADSLKLKQFDQKHELIENASDGMGEEYTVDF